MPDAARPARSPDAAARWVRDVTGAALTGVTPFTAASSSFVAALHFFDGARLVLRLHTNDQWLAREPDLATREAHALRALASHGIAAPGWWRSMKPASFAGGQRF